MSKLHNLSCDLTITVSKSGLVMWWQTYGAVTRGKIGCPFKLINSLVIFYLSTSLMFGFSLFFLLLTSFLEILRLFFSNFFSMWAVNLETHMIRYNRTWFKSSNKYFVFANFLTATDLWFLAITDKLRSKSYQVLHPWSLRLWRRPHVIARSRRTVSVKIWL